MKRCKTVKQVFHLIYNVIKERRPLCLGPGPYDGFVSSWDFTCIEDLQKRAVGERPAIKIGSRWAPLERGKISRVDDLVCMMEEEKKAA
jgi:hypothetical protein